MGMLRGVTTVSFFAEDVEAARRWEADLLGIDAYFVRGPQGAPVCVVFRIGPDQDDPGIIDRRFGPNGSSERPGGAIVYWHVDDVHAAVNRLLALGASTYEPVVERGPGFVTASVVDPFGNVLGVMENAHYLEMLTSRGA